MATKIDTWCMIKCVSCSRLGGKRRQNKWAGPVHPKQKSTPGQGENTESDSQYHNQMKLNRLVCKHHTDFPRIFLPVRTTNKKHTEIATETDLWRCVGDLVQHKRDWTDHVRIGVSVADDPHHHGRGHIIQDIQPTISRSEQLRK